MQEMTIYIVLKLLTRNVKNKKQGELVGHFRGLYTLGFLPQ
jgi:hypothetical protein